MRRELTLRAEILAGLDDSAAEVLLPQTIHRDASSQWIVPVDQPLGKRQPVRRLTRWETAKDGGYTGINAIALGRERATNAYKIRRPLSARPLRRGLERWLCSGP